MRKRRTTKSPEICVTFVGPDGRPLSPDELAEAGHRIAAMLARQFAYVRDYHPELLGDDPYESPAEAPPETTPALVRDGPPLAPPLRLRPGTRKRRRSRAELPQLRG